MAVWRRGKPAALMHHPDQGSQYTSGHFQDLLKEQGITCSVSRAGEVWDNSAMESFFSSMTTERIARKVYRTREEVRSDVFDYIDLTGRIGMHAATMKATALVGSDRFRHPPKEGKGLESDVLESTVADVCL